MASPISYGIPLFNGIDLSGWSSSEPGWEVENGILRNIDVGDGHNHLHYNTQLSSDEFSFEMRIRVVDCTNTYPRPRIYMDWEGDEFYFGNEGFINQFGIYGNDLSNIMQVGDDSYNIGDWYVLRLEVDAHDHVTFFKNGILTHTATRIIQMPLDILIKPGDDWSAGHIEISSITYVPEPATLLLFGLGGLMLRRKE